MKALQLLCATSNPAKLREFQLAAGRNIVIRPAPPASCPEDGDTFEENAVAKALCYAGRLSGQGQTADRAQPLLFADDSGLPVDALGGAPGVYSSRFAGPGADDQANNALLLEKLAGLPGEKRGARFVCCIALVRGAQVLRIFRAEAAGRILDEPRGTGGFGYDPLFFYPELGKSFAELSPPEKWERSHRGQAFRQMIAWRRDHAAGQT